MYSGNSSLQIDAGDAGRVERRHGVRLGSAPRSRHRVREGSGNIIEPPRESIAAGGLHADRPALIAHGDREVWRNACVPRHRGRTNYERVAPLDTCVARGYMQHQASGNRVERGEPQRLPAGLDPERGGSHQRRDGGGCEQACAPHPLARHDGRQRDAGRGHARHPPASPRGCPHRAGEDPPRSPRPSPADPPAPGTALRCTARAPGPRAQAHGGRARPHKGPS